MTYEVHLFEASAIASTAAEGPYRPGNRHSMLVFLRQPRGLDHDWASAEQYVQRNGWTDVIFRRAGTLTSESLNGKDASLQGAFQSALQEGSGIVIYNDPVTEEDARG